LISQISQIAAPAGYQQNGQDNQSKNEIDYSESAPYAIVTARIRRIWRILIDGWG
jgi:hypothetical protein